MHEILVLRTRDGEDLHFDIHGLVDHWDRSESVVCYNAATDEFVVTDGMGVLRTDQQRIGEAVSDHFMFAVEPSSTWKVANKKYGKDGHPLTLTRLHEPQ